MRGAAKPAPRMVAIGERQRLVDARRRDLVERGAQRHVRGHARHPQVVEHVHLAEKALMARQMREHLVLVVEVPAAGVQRGLVERREYDAIEPLRQRQLNHVRKRFAAHPSRLGRDSTSPDAARVQIVEVDEWNVEPTQPVPLDFLGRTIASPRQADAGVAHALFQHSSIADDQHAGSVHRAAVSENARALLRADTGCVAKHQAEHRKRSLRQVGHFSLTLVKR